MVDPLENASLTQPTAKDIYARILPIIKSTSQGILAERVRSAGLEQVHAANTQALVDSLTDAGSATDLEIRTIIHEANTGNLETFWEQLGEENQRGLRLNHDYKGLKYTPEELISLSKSPMWPALQKLRPDTYKLPQ